MYMENYDVLNRKEAIELPIVYAIETSTETEYDKRTTNAQDFIDEQAKHSYCRQTSSTVRDPRLVRTRMVFWIALHP